MTKHDSIERKIIIEERGFPWSMWRKVAVYKERVPNYRICEEENHQWVYKDNKKRKCKICKRKEIYDSYFNNGMGGGYEIWQESE